MINYGDKVVMEYVGKNAIQTREYISREYYLANKDNKKLADIFSYGSFVENSLIGNAISTLDVGDIGYFITNFGGGDVKHGVRIVDIKNNI